MSRRARTALLVLTLVLASPAAHAQLGSMLSPGPLATAHAALEGGTTCAQCHEAGRKVTAARCVACHKPIADRIAARKGVHRNVTECVSCHTDHAGRGGDLRHLVLRTFDHSRHAEYPLVGEHAKTATECAACHKSRTFLDARTSCDSCHTDVHKGALGTDCTRCHSTSVAFKRSRERFDHGQARFPLTGAHRQVTCDKCHKTSAYREPEPAGGQPVGACGTCHQDPHGRRFDPACTSCHTTDTWATRNISHARTRFPLVGAHAQVACVACHRDGAMTKPVRFDQCSACHANVHRDSLKGDCRLCHTETTFKGAPFDHAVRTIFTLEGKHQGLTCAACHRNLSDGTVPLAKKAVDYGGAPTSCSGCHAAVDPHKGTFGRACDACHGTKTFSVQGFAHPRAPEFFGGRHQPVRCEKCHVPDTAPKPVRAKTPTFQCVSCHDDTHLGQLNPKCEVCHTVEAERFAASRFSHQSSRFQLTGRHLTTTCSQCHTRETRAFPSRTGTAIAFSPVAMDCKTCHTDPHLGQVATACATCHNTDTFAVKTFVHTGMDDFFGGLHGRYACVDCHKSETATFPAARGTAVRFRVGRECSSCHRGF